MRYNRISIIAAIIRSLEKINKREGRARNKRKTEKKRQTGKD